MADTLDFSHLSLPFCDVMTLVTSFPEEQQDLERALLTVLYSNVCLLRQAYDELCKTCATLHPTMICLTKTHLCQDAADTICPAGYMVASRRDRSRHGGGVVIMVQENFLFDEIDTTAVSLPDVPKIVAISHREFLIVFCYRQPSISDLTLFCQLVKLLDSNTSLSPVICSDFNIQEATWLNSSHTSTAGTAALDFCESRGLHQLIHFPTRQDAMLDVSLSEHTGTTTRLPNLNNSDHVAVFLSLATFYHSAAMPPNCHVFHWSHAPWRKLLRHFCSIKWNFHGSVDDISTCFANIIHLPL